MTQDKLPPRIWAKINRNGPPPDYRPDLGPCWLWTASRRSGYAATSLPGHKNGLGHRIVYEALVGPIPEGLDLDHLCRVRHCVNPSHLEPVTRRINLLRGATLPAKYAIATHCAQGHEYTPENTTWYRNSRRCKTCNRERAREQYQAAPEAAAKIRRENRYRQVQRARQEIAE